MFSVQFILHYVTLHYDDGEMKHFQSPLLEQRLPLLFDIWQKEQLFNMDCSSPA